MTQSTYAWMGSQLHLVLDDDLANDFNLAQESFFKAQRDHKTMHNVDWDPLKDPLRIEWTPQQKKAWDQIGRVINLLVEINGGHLEISEEQITSDYLVLVQ